MGRNPLKSGQGFNIFMTLVGGLKDFGRNPLKSGQGFNAKTLQIHQWRGGYCRNPLKSGQGFNVRVIALPGVLIFMTS